MFKTRIDNEEKIAIVMSAALAEYTLILTSEQLQLGSAITPLDVETAMQNHWRAVHGLRIGKGLLKSDNNDNEDSRLNWHYQLLKGNAAYANKRGIRQTSAQTKIKIKLAMTITRTRTRTRTRISGTCNHCGKKGHKADSCWLKSGYESKAPKWFLDMKKKKDDGEVGGVAVRNVEYVCMTIETPQMSFPDDVKILKEPNKWVADSGATYDMTRNQGGQEHQPYHNCWHYGKPFIKDVWRTQQCYLQLSQK
jgi:hypothetical protein